MTVATFDHYLTLFSYLRGEGCGTIVLVPSNAVKSGSIYANVLGTSVMSDGRSASITAPNGSAQKKLIERALEVSNLKPNDVDYIEAHGTGTALGDPIEVEALAEVFAQSRSQSNPLIIGAVKANIGHLEWASGIAGFIKASLVVGHKSAQPNAALETLNPLIQKTVESKEFGVRFSTESEPLPAIANKLVVAGVSSLGASGTISHAILQRAPDNIFRDYNLSSNEEVVQDDNSQCVSHLRRGFQKMKVRSRMAALQLSFLIAFAFCGQDLRPTLCCKKIFLSQSHASLRLSFMTT